MGPASRADREAELSMVRTNIEAVVDLCTTFASGMVARHRGAILNTASTAAFQPLPVKPSTEPPRHSYSPTAGRSEPRSKARESR
jgi:NADP-dependent 3-hydroxy acid dehydrogenase YdfG